MNLPIGACIANAKQRSWEPHKYASKEAQDANLELLMELDKSLRYKNRPIFSKSASDFLQWF